jgi:hypothetical protein
MITLDVTGRHIELSLALARRLRDASAEQAASSSAARDLSLLLERAIREPERVVALRRAEARLLVQFVDVEDVEAAGLIVRLLS